eukprot:TRINITY_DN2224_c0_g1_i1.p1 TRINITY_DN2224_c0_g1~~TRINITY_DN2224_c0_g1_i1.p1  ORF type:complete len:350 (+),score=54.09 TRINITY_DN2224_c0_g1_i1:86-1051(+)
MSSKRVISIGIDGGGTKTSTCALDVESGKSLGIAKTPSSNWNSVGVEKAKEALRSGIDEAAKTANAELRDIVSICLSMAGVDRPADKDKVISWVNEMLPHVQNKDIHVHSDAVAALAGGTNGQLYGVVVISGTGMISYGFDKSANSKRAGGWGPLLGDEGSGYAIASDVLRAVVSAQDGRGPRTQLLDDVLTKLKLPDATQLIPWAYDESDRSWAKFAALAPIAYDCANKGDQVALAILDNAADKLAATIDAVVKGLQLDTNADFPLVLAGGNLTHENSILAKLLKERLRKAYPNSVITHPTVDAEVAAALLAANQYKSHQ